MALAAGVGTFAALELLLNFAVKDPLPFKWNATSGGVVAILLILMFRWVTRVGYGHPNNPWERKLIENVQAYLETKKALRLPGVKEALPNIHQLPSLDYDFTRSGNALTALANAKQLMAPSQARFALSAASSSENCSGNLDSVKPETTVEP